MAACHVQIRLGGWGAENLAVGGPTLLRHEGEESDMGRYEVLTLPNTYTGQNNP